MKSAAMPLDSSKLIDLILVGYDGSRHADRALDAAAEFASRFNAALHLVCAYADVHPRPEMEELARVEHMPDQAVYLQLEAARERLFRENETALRSKGIREVRSTLVRGHPTEQILAYAQSAPADLIILGKRGLGPVGRTLLGSVSSQVASLAPCPVLIV